MMLNLKAIYNDPLFGIVLLLIIIAFIAIIDYVKNYYKEYKRANSIKQLTKNYEYMDANIGAQEFIKTAKDPIPTLLFLAHTYAKSGDSEQAIKIYLAILNSIENTNEKIPVLQELGLTYFNAGFLQRGKDIFLEILKYYPRNEIALLYLMRICEDLGEYKFALEALNCLLELNYQNSLDAKEGREKDLNLNFYKAKNYLEALIILNDHNFSISEKNKKLVEILSTTSDLSRLILEHLRLYDMVIFWEELLKQEDLKSDLPVIINAIKSNKSKILEIISMANVVENIEKIEKLECKLEDKNKEKLKLENQNNLKILQDIARAYGVLNDGENCGIFELEAMRSLNLNSKTKADLEFEFRCTSCKHIAPFDSYRCPICGNLDKMDILIKLKETKTYDKKEYRNFL